MLYMIFDGMETLIPLRGLVLYGRLRGDVRA